MPLSPELESQLEHVTELPSPPKIAAQIIRMAQDPDVSLLEVAKIVSKDPALTAKILRIANSALYNRRRKSESLRQAVVVLGLHATLTLALSFSLVSSLRRDRPKGVDYRAFWRRALLSATAARALSEVLEREDGEELFLGALLQDIGMLAIDKALPSIYAGCDAGVTEHHALALFETERLGCDHADVGGWLLKRWNLSQRLRLAVTHSHQVDFLASEHEYAQFVRCVALSGPLADVWLSEGLDESLHALGEQAQRLIGLDFTQLATVLAMVRNRLAETQSLYEVELLEPGVAENVLDHARELIMARNLSALDRAGKPQAPAGGVEDGWSDPETGLYNKRYIEQFLDKELKAAREFGWPVNIACLRVDVSGKQIMHAVAAMLDAHTRDCDVTARYGPQDFVVTLSGTRREDAHAVCRRLVQDLQEAAVEDGQGNTYLGVPVWAGLAGSEDASDFASGENLLRAAVRAMHAAMRGDGDDLVYDGAGGADPLAPPGEQQPASRSFLSRLFSTGS